MTGLELVQEVAEKHGITNLSEDDKSYILWNHTGFPSFVPTGVEAEDHFRSQLDTYFQDTKRASAQISEIIEESK